MPSSAAPAGRSASRGQSTISTTFAATKGGAPASPRKPVVEGGITKASPAKLATPPKTPKKTPPASKRTPPSSADDATNEPRRTLFGYFPTLKPSNQVRCYDLSRSHHLRRDDDVVTAAAPVDRFCHGRARMHLASEAHGCGERALPPSLCSRLARSDRQDSLPANSL